MRLNIFFLFSILLFHSPIFGQIGEDSLVLFSDLKFHSELEKDAIQNYAKNKTDTFNLFLAIDEHISKELVPRYYKSYRTMLNALYTKKIDARKLEKRIKNTFTLIHDKYLRKYNDVEYFPVVLEKGTYNCVSSSILYALIFEELKIPFKVQVTTSHTYLVANPGPKSIVVETTNPKLNRSEYINDFKRQYVSQLKSLKVISEEEFKNKSLDEIFEEKVKEVKPAEFDNLIGFQYYNKGLTEYNKNKFEEAYELLQKAYFFYPSNQVRSVLYPVLINQVERCKFSKVSDIDYLAQLNRFEEVTSGMVSNVFGDILKYYLQYTDSQSYCDSLYERLIHQINDRQAREEISFNYYLLMSKNYKDKDEQQKYIENALSIKQNHREANKLFISFIERKLNKINAYANLIDSIKHLRERYHYDFVDSLLLEYELMAHLDKAYDFFKYNYIDEGEIYLKSFEKEANHPIESENKQFVRAIETVYRTLAIYYFYRKNKQKALETIERGLKYVPGSRYIQTAVY